MITIDCPFCDGTATTDEALVAVRCDGCGVAVDVVPEVTPVRELDRAA